MAFSVRFARRAERDLADLYDRINAVASDAALASYQGLKEAILSLEENPSRCSMTPESNKFKHLLYGRGRHVYRVIFRVLEKQKQAEIVHIRHGARDAFKLRIPP